MRVREEGARRTSDDAGVGEWVVTQSSKDGFGSLSKLRSVPFQLDDSGGGTHFPFWMNDGDSNLLVDSQERYFTNDFLPVLPSSV